MGIFTSTEIIQDGIKYPVLGGEGNLRYYVDKYNLKGFVRVNIYDIYMTSKPEEAEKLRRSFIYNCDTGARAYC